MAVTKSIYKSFLTDKLRAIRQCSLHANVRYFKGLSKGMGSVCTLDFIEEKV